jgi:sugar/nucleoside kinase (ribokinase family)
MTRPAIEVVHIGSACRDIAPEDPRGWRIGGGVMYAALTTARLGVRTAAVVGVDGEAADAAELAMLGEAGVDILRVDLTEGPVYHNVETTSGRVQTCVQPGVPLPLRTLPSAWMAAPGWSIVPVAGEVRDDWAQVIPADAHVAVAWQGFLRDLRAGEQVRQLAPRPSPILERADLIGVSRHDVGRDIPLPALERLLRPGADLLVTEGDAGGLLIRLGTDDPAELLRYRSPASGDEVDPTGAGDTFLAALHASGIRAAATPAAAATAATPAAAATPGAASAASPGPGTATATMRRAIRDGLDLRFAAAAGSLVVEDWGLAGVPDLAAVTTRLERDAGPGTVTLIPTEDASRFWSEGPPAA